MKTKINNKMLARGTESEYIQCIYEAPMNAKAQMSKWGNSLAVRIPKEVAEKANLREGDALILEVEEKGTIAVKAEDATPSLKQLVSKITKENVHSEMDWGGPLGNEQW